MIRKIARFSRVSLAALAFLGLVVLTLLGLLGEGALRTQVERRLTSALHRQVRIGALSVNLGARVVELRDVVIPGLPESKRPSFTAPRVRIALSFRSLFTSHIRLRGLEIEAPQVSVQVLPDGSTDLPELPPSSAGPSRQVSIGRLTLQAGQFFLKEQRIPLDLDLPGFEASLTSDAKNPVKGELRAGPGPMRIGALPAENARFDLGVRYADSILHVDQGSFKSGGTSLSLSGELNIHAAPKGVLRLTGPFDLETFDRSVVGTGLGLKGMARSDGLVSFADGKIALNATLEGHDGLYDSIPVAAFATTLTWDGSTVHFKKLTLEALGGSAELDVDVPKASAVRVAGVLNGLSAEPLLHWLFGYGTAGLGSRVGGPIDLSFPQGDAQRFSGTGDLSLAADPALGEPLSGRFPFTAERGVIGMSGVQFAVPRSKVSLGGTLQLDKSVNLDVRLASEDLAKADALAVRLRGAFGATAPQALAVGGRGGLDGQVTGTLNEPVFIGRFQGSSVAYLGVPWGEVDWTGSASAHELRSDRLVASKGGARVELSGVQRLGDLGVDDAMDLTVAIKEWSVRSLLHVIQSELDLDADTTGTLRLQGTRARPLGEGRLESATGKALGLSFTRGDLRLRFEGEATRVQSLTAVVGSGDLVVKGLLTDRAGVPAFDGDVELKAVELSDLGLQDEQAPMIGGRVNGRAILGGPIETPRVAAHLESTRLFYGDEGVGAMTLDINGAGDGVLSVTGQSDSPRFKATLTGTVEAKAPHLSRLEVKVTNARIDPVLRALGSRFENAVVITASATASVEGPLLDPDSIVAHVREGRLRIGVPEYAIETAPGFAIDVEKRAIRIAGLTLQGEGTSLSVSGKLALKPDDTNDLAITGRADLRAFSGFLREWRFRGAATLRSQIGGTPGAIRVSGGLDIEDGSARLRTFPQGLDGLNGRLLFNETQARVAGLEGRFGGGRVSVSGQIGFGGAVPPSFDFSFSGDSLGLRYPEGLRSTFGASLRLQGTAESHWLTGNLSVVKAQWTRKYVITSQLLSSESSPIGLVRTATSLRSSPMHLDIAIKAPGTLRLDNNLASLAAKADLTLTGSPTEPQLLGRMEVERGKVFFRGNTYEVRKGVVQFSNPREINPVFDIEADTRLRSYRLTLQANGTLDRVSTRITSDPPLTAPQIASLLTGGDENDVANLAGSSTDIKTLGTGGVNSFASSWLDDNLTGKVAQGFGLSRLSIDPGKGLLSRNGSRLTVGKRVTQDLEVVYSRTIFGGTESQFATAEYSLTNRFSLIVSWAEPGGFGADIRTRFVLGR